MVCCFAIVSSIHLAEASAQQRNRPLRDDSVVQYAKAEGVVEKVGNTYETVLNLGRLGVSKKVIVTMTFKNQTDDEIEFSDVSKKCSCSAFKKKNYVIPAGAEQEVKLTIKTPARARSKESSQWVTFVERGGSTVLRAELKFELDGILAFKEAMGILEFQADNNFREVQLPLVITDPVQLETVEIETSENLQDISFTIEKSENGAFVKAKISDKILADGKVRGEIYISSPAAASKDCYFLVVRDSATDDISPNVLSFRSKNGVVSATAIVQIAARHHETPANPIGASFRGQEIPVEIKMLKKNTFRVQLNLNDELVAAMSNAGAEQENSKPSEISWSINNGKTTTQKATAFVIEQAN